MFLKEYQSIMRKMGNNYLSMISLTLFLFLLLVEGSVDYHNQASWGGSCTTGNIQTPININRKTLNACPDNGYQKITFLCEDFPVTFTGVDMSVVVNQKVFAFFVNEREMKYEAYESYNAHFHTPSEHQINGQSFAAQMHLKLRPTTFNNLPAEALGDYQNFNFSTLTESNHFHSVVAILFKESSNASVDFFDEATYENGSTFVNNGTPTWNMKRMAGCVEDKFWYEYIGSTTTPPCTEDVRWLITRAPIYLKPEHLARILEIKEQNPNNRQIQPLNNRKVSLLGEYCVQMR